MTALDVCACLRADSFQRPTARGRRRSILRKETAVYGWHGRRLTAELRFLASHEADSEKQPSTDDGAFYEICKNVLHSSALIAWGGVSPDKRQDYCFVHATHLRRDRNREWRVKSIFLRSGATIRVELNSSRGRSEFY